MAKKINEGRKEAYERENLAARKLTRWIGSGLAVLVLVLILGGLLYSHHALQPYNRHDERYVAVDIPAGATDKDIANILAQKHVIRSARVFNLWLKLHSQGGFQAGKFYVSASMATPQLVSQLQGSGDRPVAGTLLIREGETIDQVATELGKSGHFSRQEFLALMKDPSFMHELAAKYPRLLSSSMKKHNVRYHLEGYLFPARYNIYKGASLKQLVTQMVGKTNQVLLPYYATIKKKGLTVHKVLTLASLVEREGVTTKDRRKIAGVFFNRFAADMPLQSDISVMYALNKHKHSLTIKDTKVKSPYNLYKHKGYGPGPFNNPGLDSISAVLHPSDRSENYLYFVANLKTGKVYYSQNLNQHLRRNASLGQ
ncbi:MAG: endolytic transglycosylase MltG [Lactobacillus sp.]